MTSIRDLVRRIARLEDENKAVRNQLEMAVRRLSIVEGMQSTNNVTKDTGSDVGVASDELYTCLDIPVFWGVDDGGTVRLGKISLQWNGTKWIGGGPGVLVTSPSASASGPVSDPSGTDLTLVKNHGTGIYCHLSNVILATDNGVRLNADATWYSDSQMKSGAMVVVFADSKAYPVGVLA